jgi:signal transduction histidine kinase
MTTQLKTLMVEDSPDDTDLILSELRRAGFDPQWKRVESEEDFLAEIEKLPDIILSDYSMPRFTGLRAAKLLRESGLNIPFILVSGTVGEESAVEAIRNGATDYLLKDRLTRLGPAVTRALREAQDRKKLQEEVASRARMQEQLRQAQKMEAIGQLAGGVAHDFNNILTATLMQLSLLQQNPLLSPATKESLQEIERETHRASNLTRQLLLFSQRQAARVQPLDLDVLIRELLKMLRRLLGENIEVVFPGCPGAHWVCADPSMMEQVVMNLCINSRDAMPKGGQIISTTKVDIQAQSFTPQTRRGQFVCMSVSDTGCGMDETVMERVFEPFFTTKEPGKGTGLGLATVYGIVKQHEGWVEVESKPTEGSSFRVYLPAGTSSSGDSGTSHQAEEIQGGSETILLVEDELFLRRLAAMCLRKLGYAVFEAGNGLEALNLWELHSQKIALLLTDMVMPGNISGLDLAIRFKKEKASLKVVSCSGYTADLDLIAEQGIDFLPKPYAPAALAKIVRHCLDKP